MHLDNKDILFVTCVNNQSMYETCRKYINELHVPESYSVRFLPVTNAKSMCEGYNRALLHKAKYKIYLHQDVFLIYKNALVEIIQVFKNNPQIGLMGLVGNKNFKNFGHNWEWNTGIIYAHSIQNPSLQVWGKVDNPFTYVAEIDGLFMATQYDIPWREDLFTGFHSYDVSQSKEFLLKGYHIAIPYHTEPWCIHQHGSYEDIHTKIGPGSFKHSNSIYLLTYGPYFKKQEPKNKKLKSNIKAAPPKKVTQLMLKRIRRKRKRNLLAGRKSRTKLR